MTFGRDSCGDWEEAIRREWLVTNGLGGWALIGALVAIPAAAPPKDRLPPKPSTSFWNPRMLSRWSQHPL